MKKERLWLNLPMKILVGLMLFFIADLMGYQNGYMHGYDWGRKEAEEFTQRASKALYEKIKDSKCAKKRGVLDDIKRMKGE